MIWCCEIWSGMLLALLILYGRLNWMIIDRYMYGPPPAPTPTQPSRMRRLHFPPSGRARTEASWRPVMYRFKIYTGTWIYVDEVIEHNIDRHTCTHLPAPPPSQSPESTEVPLSSPRKSRRQSWPTRSRALVQFNSASWYLWAYFIMNMYPPTPTPDQSLESAEAPLSSLGRGRRQGVPAHNPCNGSDR